MTPLGLALEWFVNVDHIPIIVGLRRGFFREEGLDLQVLEPVSHEAGMVLAATGKLDVAVTEPIHLPGAVSQGLELRAFGKYFVTGFGIMVKAGVSNPAQLAGQRIAAPLGVYAPVIIKAMAEHEGVRLSDEDLQFVNVGYYLTDALLKGKADAAFAAFENYELVEARYHGLDVDILRFTDYGVPSYGYLVFVAHPEAITGRRKELEGFLAAVKRGVEFTLKNPKEALDIFLEEVPVLDAELTRRLFEATLKCYTTDTSLKLEEWERLAAFASGKGLASRQVSGQELIAPLG